MRKCRHILYWLPVALLTAYVISVGAVPAVLRHTGDSGRLQWLAAVPWAVRVLEAYEWPARQLSRARPVHRVFEFSCSVWWVLLAPPDTTP
jgi:hypothetical protein